MIIEIINENNVNIENNLIYTNSGYRSSNIIPFSKITFFSEVTSQSNGDNRGYLFVKLLLNTVELIIKINYNDELGNEEEKNDIMYFVYTKINEAMIDIYKSKHYNFKKPKKFNPNKEQSKN